MIFLTMILTTYKRMFNKKRKENCVTLCKILINGSENQQYTASLTEENESSY